MLRLTATLLVTLAAFSGAATPGSAPPVLAHALLLQSEPPVNATLQDAPRQITLYFSEPLERQFSSVSVVDQDGQRPQQTVEFDDSDDTVMRVLLEPAGPGFLVVSWETVSVVDGHRITGSFPITILNQDGSLPAAAPPAAVSARGEEAQADLAVAKFLQLAAGCLLAGALLFTLWVAPALRRDAGDAAGLASDRRCLVAAIAALLVIAAAAVGELLLQASNIGSSAGDVLATRWGERWLLRQVLLAVALAAIVTSILQAQLRRWLIPAGLAAAAVAFATVSSTSHAAAGAGSFWATTIDFVHLFAASVWIGMLAMLALLFAWARRELPRESRPPVLETGLQRFSSVAVVSLTLLLLTGTLSAVIEIARLDDLVDTGYGRALLLKLLLVLPLLSVAAYNAYILRPRYAMSTGDPTSDGDERLARFEGRFARTIGVELALALGVLLVAAFLVQITPARGAGSTSASATFSEMSDAGDFEVTLTVEPARPGFNSFEVGLAGDVSVVEQVRLEFFDRSGGTSEARLVLDGANGAYAGRGPFLDKAGDWQVRVNLRQSRDSDLSVPFELSIAEPAGPGGRGGTFDSPVQWTATRVLIAAVAVLLAVALAFASLCGGARHGGYAGAMLRRLRLFGTGRVSR